jgi:hypothetical protein
VKAIHFALLMFIVPGARGEAQPAVSLVPSTLMFGQQGVGTTGTAQTVTMTNTGNASLSITSIKITGASRTDFAETNACGKTLAAGANCSISVTFTPTVIGSRNAALSVTDNAVGGPQTVSLTGTGTAPAVTFSAVNLIFNKQPIGTASSPQKVTLTNTGNTTLSLTSIAGSGDFSQTNTCGPSLGAGASCTISVTFTPSSLWTRWGFITVIDNALDSPDLIPVAGMGTGIAVAHLSPTSLSFGNQNIGTSSPAQTITLSNPGTDILALSSIAVSGDYSQSNTCGTSLPAGANCTISVLFTPSASGTRQGYITFNDTDPTILQTATLSGTGQPVSSTVAVSPRVAVITSTRTQQFQATINGVGTSSVTWAVDSITGGNTTTGTISAAGVYTPPATAGQHSVTAASIADPSQTATVPVVVSNYAGAFGYHNDPQSTGQNLNEIALTTGNVNSAQFGKLFSYAIDGYAYAQPLYVENVSIPNQGFHNVVYIATEHDSVYAFDADDLNPAPLWQTSFIDPTNGITTVPRADVEGPGSNITPEVGITPTPVIDPTRNALYAIARTKEVVGGVTSYVQRLHALDITTGAELPNSPVVIAATVNGTGSGGRNGQVAFDPLRENPRAGLLLLNGVVYVTWGSLGDIPPYHGWLLGYDGGTLQQVAVLNTSPNGSDAAIWQSGGAPVVDASGNIFLMTGNGTFDANTSGLDYGTSFLKIYSGGGGLQIADYFTPYNKSTLNSKDFDLGSGGPMLLPDQPGPAAHLALAAGKDSGLYLLNRDNLGQFSPAGNNIALYLANAIGKASESAGGHRGTPAYFQGQVYLIGASDFPKAFSLYNGLLSAAPVSLASTLFGFPGGVPAISANGSVNGIVWALQVDKYSTSGPAVLHAYDAANVARELYNSKTSGTRDTAGPAVKFTVPTVANGKVYVATQTELDVYGLLP